MERKQHGSSNVFAGLTGLRFGVEVSESHDV